VPGGDDDVTREDDDRRVEDASRADDAEGLRVERASKLRVDEAIRNERITAHLERHDLAIKAMRESIEGQRLGTAAVQSIVEMQSDKLDQLITAQTIQAAVEKDRAKTERDRVAEIKAANEKQVSVRAFGVGVATVLVAMVGIMVTLLVAVHAI
jgi:hypothetical protein